ncbi:primase C-terminal domain-containing protein [Furfurilactobacillus sp. WILCCON 0119]
MDQAWQAIEQILHHSLHTYQPRNSKLVALTDHEDLNKKGSIAGFRSKAAMSHSHGVVYTSFEALHKDYTKLTHWTPNPFVWLGYGGADRNYIRGHAANNLQQLNAFVIDVDFASPAMMKAQQSTILERLVIDDNMIPTMVLSTDKGFHAYYVLEQPFFFKRHANGQMPGLTVAQKIADNLKAYVSQGLPTVDVGCNNFGIFRMPHEDNLLAYLPESTFSFDQFADWSKRFSATQKAQVDLHVVQTPKFAAQTQQAWFKELLQVTDIHAGEGLGRHNTILTLALACYSSAWSEAAAFDLLDEFNSNLAAPLHNQEVQRTVHDAFSGRYNGAAKAYIRELCAIWLGTTPKFGAGTPAQWTKFAKPRAARQYSHLHEWASDVVAYVNRVGNGQDRIAISTRDLRKALHISAASLQKVLSQLQLAGKLFVQPGRGRRPALMATQAMLIKTLLTKQRAQQDAWWTFIRQALVDLGQFKVAKTTTQPAPESLLLALVDTG